MSNVVVIPEPPMDLPDRYQAVCERNRELFETVEQLRMALHRKNEIIRATSIEHIRLRAGLREALDGWKATERVLHRECPNDEDEDEHPATLRKIAELRKLLGGES